MLKDSHSFTALRQLPQQRREACLRMAGWVWFAGCLGVLLVFFYKRYPALVHSDLASELIYSQLLAQNGGLLSTGWYYGPELTLFRAQLVFTPLFWVFDNWAFIRMAGSLIWLALYLASFYYVCRAAGAQRFYPLAAGVLLLPFSQDYFDNVLFGIYYIPYLVLSLLCMGLLLRLAQGPRTRRTPWQAAALACLAFVAGVNGLRQLLVLFLPLVCAAAWVVWRAGAKADTAFHALRGPAARLLAYGGAATLVSGVGYLLNSRVLSQIYSFKDYEALLHFINLHDYRVEATANSWLLAFGYDSGQEVGELFNTGLLVHNAAAFVLIAVVVLSLHDIFRRPEQHGFCIQVLARFWVAGFVLMSGLYVFTNMSTNARYAIPLLVFTPLLVGSCLAHLPQGPHWAKGICLGLVCALTLSAVVFYQQERQIDNNTARREVAAFLQENGYTRGYATFWNANVLTELTNGTVEVWAWPDGATDFTDPQEIHEGLQLVAHSEHPPEGPFFVLFTTEECQTMAIAQNLDAANLIYQTDAYTAYRYDSYESFVADIQSS